MSYVISPQLENARIAQQQMVQEMLSRKLEAVLEYVAMMTDVELIEDEEEGNEDAQQDV